MNDHDATKKCIFTFYSPTLSKALKSQHISVIFTHAKSYPRFLAALFPRISDRQMNKRIKKDPYTFYCCETRINNSIYFSQPTEKCFAGWIFNLSIYLSLYTYKSYLCSLFSINFWNLFCCNFDPKRCFVPFLTVINKKKCCRKKGSSI